MQSGGLLRIVRPQWRNSSATGVTRVPGRSHSAQCPEASMTSMLRFMFVLLLAGPGLTACCRSVQVSAPGRPSDHLLVAMAAHLRVPASAEGSHEGTAIGLGDNRFLTVRHIFPEWSLADDAPPVTGFVNGEAVTLRVVDAGLRTDAPDEDWAIVAVDGDELPFGPDAERARSGYSVRLGAPGFQAPGTEVWAVGYWGISTDDERAEDFPAPSWTSGRIIRRPWAIRLPDGVVPIAINASYHALEGTSGGPVVAVDHASQTITIVGLYRGMRQLRFLGWTVCGVHIAREIPEEAQQ